VWRDHEQSLGNTGLWEREGLQSFQNICKAHFKIINVMIACFYERQRNLED
jgi:hypothetical protein